MAEVDPVLLVSPRMRVIRLSVAIRLAGPWLMAVCELRIEVWRRELVAWHAISSLLALRPRVLAQNASSILKGRGIRILQDLHKQKA